MKIIFIASAASIHSLRWIKFFGKKNEFEIEWITFAEPTHQTKEEYENMSNDDKGKFHRRMSQRYGKSGEKDLEKFQNFFPVNQR